MDKPVKPDGKKPYTSPLLTVYGTVRELTQKVGLLRTQDGGRFPRVRTSVR
ncbi:MAG TPA: lasso RiPP family leader peptide-containing protein [archaeon]|nr:lasso RiPP family leader peptide-containing protein [archaeon]